MTRPVLTRIKTRLLIGASVTWAWSTGIFFAIPTLSPAIGIFGITIALIYSWAACLFGKKTIWLSICLTIAITIAFNITTGSDFSFSNYIVLHTIAFNFILFGFLGNSLRGEMTLMRSWCITAGLFGGSLGLGWLVGVISS
jgi:hypothetical protein